MAPVREGQRSEKAFDPASLWKMIRMRFPWQPQVYVRACAECGYTWRVPRWAAQRRVRSISMISVASRTTIDRGELTREIESASAANQSADTFRHCPECGADHFTQCALRSESPD
jgi:DNA-directed RNA polymerase subunit M/transcription elongation factor TFIIS